MAASDEFYRSQRLLDKVFGISCILMLISIIWMFAQDYYRPFKTEQRVFRDVEEAVALQEAVDNLGDVRNLKERFDLAKQEVEKAIKLKEKNKEKIQKLTKEIIDIRPARDKAEAKYQGIKAEVDSLMSFYNIAVENSDLPPEENPEAISYKDEIDSLKIKLAEAKKIRDEKVSEILALQKERDKLEQPLVEAAIRWKKINEKLDSYVGTAQKKRWTIYDSIRAFPVIDGFASPIKIHQFTINNIPINYNFKYVTRFDRCTTCHLGIDRPAYTKERLRSLHPENRTREMEDKLEIIRYMLEERKKTLSVLPEEAKQVPDPANLELVALSKDYLTDARINQFCVHPRLDLFVGPNSPHPAEKFGCTSCHAGQGSATDFYNASHTPNNSITKEKWVKEKGWESNHFWDFPMHPQRFVESSCLKCHHEVTDLISKNNRIEAPKLFRGYNLVRENGCFGCHEIKGWKDGRSIGPDMRLEPYPPMVNRSPMEQKAMKADPDTQPGTYRKTGPSLFRISEKTNRKWMEKWLRSPRGFRPDTRMPHFYGLANNHEKVLPEGQKAFPNAEIQGIAFYLLEESKKYLTDVEKHADDPREDQERDKKVVSIIRQLTKDQYAYLRQNDTEDLNEILLLLKLDPSTEEKLRKQIRENPEKEIHKLLTQTQRRIRLREEHGPLEPLIDGYAGDVETGRKLFIEKGCLSCHRHDATREAQFDLPTIESEAQFGPDLSQLREKLGKKAGDEASARLWLMNWIKNPNIHSSRTKMPVVTLTDKEIVDITTWLLAQDPATSVGDTWKNLNVELKNNQAFFDLTEVYLAPLISQDLLNELKKNKSLDLNLVSDLGVDEQYIIEKYSLDRAKYYVGKKAINRLGCFACHDIPGFEDAKPIGTGLNDWGKKDPNKLAFEDSEAFVEEHFNLVSKRLDMNGNPHQFEKGEHGQIKKPMEKFFFDKLEHHDRIGFLNLKLINPRSYDFNRIKSWTDRLRMPQFRFARTVRKKNSPEEFKKTGQMYAESREDFEARRWKEEAEAREAVMTFVLGLVAEKVPLRSIHTPSGDSLALAKGRQVLDKFNCAGCHIVRPGIFEFNFNPQTNQLIEGTYKRLKNKLKQDYDFMQHHAWAGHRIASNIGTLTAFGKLETIVDPKTDLPQLIQADIKDPSKKVISIRLTEAIRFQDDKGNTRDLRAAESLSLPIDTLIFPPREAFTSDEALREFQENRGMYGGKFADILSKYLVEAYPKEYPLPGPIEKILKESNLARASSPPALLGQGARTQPKWLFNFLLNPTPIRAMVKLRMPKFNMSEEDAQALVDYFAAVEKHANKRYGLTFPFVEIPQKSDLTSLYWQKKNREYVERLKNTPLPNQIMAEGGKVLKTYEEERIHMLTPIWERILEQNKDKLAQAKKELEGVKSQLKDAEKVTNEVLMKMIKANTAKEEAKKFLDKAKEDKADAKKIKELEKQFAEAENKAEAKAKALSQQQAEQTLVDLTKKNWEAEIERLEALVEKSKLPNRIEQWREQDAYVIDSFRLLGSPDSVCLKCHQVGSAKPRDAQGQGPMLSLAQNRLRPQWVKHWIGHPDRLMTYPSPMPVYFPNNTAPTDSRLFLGTPQQHILALRDVLMIYTRVENMDVNRYTVLPIAKGEKE